MTAKLTKIRLMGALAQFGEEWDLWISTPAEAVRAIGCQCAEFVRFLATAHEQGIAFQIVADDPDGMDQDDLLMPFQSVELTIMPVIQGAGGFGKILLGIALIGVAFLVPGGILGLSSTTIGLIGASLVLSGISQLLTPTPKKPDENEQQGSFLFDQVSRTTEQGKPVPILIGRRRIDMQLVLSASIDVDRVKDD